MRRGKRDADAARIALAMGIKLCACGKVESNCETHGTIPAPTPSAPYSYKVRDPKSGHYPGSLAHQAWKDAFREKLRANPTDAERCLIAALDSSGLNGRYIFQPIVFGFIPDFGFELERVIVEVDGSIHNTTAGKRADARRDNIFRRNGWAVKRFSNSQVLTQTSAVMDVIIACVRARLDGTRPQ